MYLHFVSTVDMRRIMMYVFIYWQRCLNIEDYNGLLTVISRRIHRRRTMSDKIETTMSWDRARLYERVRVAKREQRWRSPKPLHWPSVRIINYCHLLGSGTLNLIQKSYAKKKKTINFSFLEVRSRLFSSKADSLNKKGNLQFLEKQLKNLRIVSSFHSTIKVFI